MAPNDEERRVNLDARLSSLELKIDALLSAFPDASDGTSGVVMHRQFHHDQMIAAEEKREFRNSLLKAVTTWGIIAFICFVFYAVWESVKIKARLP